jgi:hypothetical protein
MSDPILAAKDRLTRLLDQGGIRCASEWSEVAQPLRTVLAELSRLQSDNGRLREVSETLVGAPLTNTNALYEAKQLARAALLANPTEQPEPAGGAKAALVPEAREALRTVLGHLAAIGWDGPPAYVIKNELDLGSGPPSYLEEVRFREQQPQQGCELADALHVLAKHADPILVAWSALAPPANAGEA